MDHPSIYVGIDVSSKSLDFFLTPNHPSPHTHVEYSERSLDAFIERHPELMPGTAVIGVESTGEYHLAAVKYFLQRDFEVTIINPILTKQYTRTTIRGIKTDKSDAEIIAMLLQAGHGDRACLQDILSYDRELLRFSTTVTQHTSALKLLVQSAERRGFGEIDLIAEQLQSVIKDMKCLSDNFVKHATEVRTNDELLIDSIPGFSVHLSAIIHHELGDVSRFASMKSLVAFAGLDPKIRQSGTSINTKGRLSKRGSTHLRYALFIGANVAKRCDPELRAYYVKKRAESRSHTEILCMISRKLLFRICAVLREQRPYVVHA